MSATLYAARWVLPVASAPIADGAVLVEGDTIAWVGPASNAPRVRRVELGDSVLMPGLVNAHVHLELTVLRGLLDGLAFFDWVRTLTRLRATAMSADDHLVSARLGVAEGLLAGVTCYGDTADSRAPFDALREGGARGVAYRELFGPDPAQRDTSIAECEAKLDAMERDATALVRVGVSPHAPYSVSDALFTAAAAMARARGLPLAVHIAESEAESALVVNGAGRFVEFLEGRGITVTPRARTPIALLEATGVLGADCLCIHAVRTTATDIGRLRAHGASVAHCPASNAKLGHGIAPLAALVEAGVPVGLGTDSMASNDAHDLIGEARLALLAQRAYRNDPAWGSAALALELATTGGARALGLGGVVGAVVPGMQADLAAFPLDPARRGAAEPAAQLVWAQPGVRAHLTVVAGRELVRDGRLTGVPLAAVTAPADALAARLAIARESLPR
ncbi:MAG: amidohydrolase family protein [Gemmatimonadaceae bacterium]|nr:amidohydrolase family protein [Gemmatimonadaceae bacterium]